MANSPKCLICIKSGKNGQTYRVVKTNLFKCHSCKKLYPRESFQAAEFEWKTKPAEWTEFMKTKGINKAKAEKVLNATR